MKFHTEYLTLHTKTKRAYVHLTPQVESALKKSEPNKPGTDGMFPDCFFKFLGQTGVNAETFCSLAESLIPCPQKRGWIDKD